ncbi:hypothetical protein AXG93_1504s1360 [Marchantia polymorpha subsp. ruderalis]|uniref:GDSL esterase/lipase n=1 Tax=Marchantia polymorpha subsp. ruderalis TaxID=1480154 RepID=A0A176VR26_MARPO|nr:hypothetical protein AXG93_1504s1360 [Marchantia polymorpha subsp. ruderalis]
MTIPSGRRCSWKLITQVSCLLLVLSSHKASATCFPAIFNFGDSSSDTGGNHAAFPTETAAEYLPYGQTYFNEPRARYSDGRLTIDFIIGHFRLRQWGKFCNLMGNKSKSTGLPYVVPTFDTGVAVTTQHPYKKLYDELFRGKNDSFSGAVETTTSQDPELKIALEAARRIPLTEYFEQGLYIISIGTSDFSAGIAKQQTLLDIEAYLPDIVTGITNAVKAIYNEGARTIIVGGVGPIGCLPVQLTVITHDATQLDNFGCLAPYNTLVRSYNVQLKQALVDLRVQLPLATIVYLDNYQLQHNLLFNNTQNGISVGIQSCCGVPSTYNFNDKVQCGETGIVDGGLFLVSQTCPNPVNFTIWDGYHYTEAANRYFARQILSGRYFDLPFSLIPDNCTANQI